MFYAVSALSNAHGFNTSKHSTLQGWFNKNIVHSGKIALDIGILYREIFDLRSKGDYDDFIKIRLDVVKRYLDAAKLFIDAVRRLTLERLEENKS
jgi:uncharacterized protein (UPF0332 family)